MNIFYPVQILADWLTFSVAKLNPQSQAGASLNFFIFDSIKIFTLLVLVIFSVALLRSYLPPEKIRSLLSARRAYVGNVLAALLGVATPFCTCSAIPLFLGFIQAGVPLGVTFSFLVSSPMVNEVALVLLFGMFGWKIALFYAASGIIIATFSGMALGRMKVEHLLEDFVINTKSKNGMSPKTPNGKQRTVQAWRYTSETLGKIWPYVLLGIGAGAFIHGYVPMDFLAAYAGADKWYAVPLATLIGIPLYGNAAGIAPLVSSLTDKGLAVGTSLSFMMAVTALSLPEFMILKKIMKPKLIIIFALTVGLGIMLTGYAFNAILS